MTVGRVKEGSYHCTKASSRVQLHLKQFLSSTCGAVISPSPMAPDPANNVSHRLVFKDSAHSAVPSVPTPNYDEPFYKTQDSAVQDSTDSTVQRAESSPSSATQNHVVAIWQARTADPGKRTVHSSSYPLTDTQSRDSQHIRHRMRLSFPP
jgi:hypothetical protein